MTGNSSRKHMRNDIIWSFFYITTHRGKEISPIQVILEFPHIKWVKVNTDGVTRGCPGFLACACIFRGSRGEYIDSFSSLGYKSLYMLRLWESFWLLSLLGVKTSNVFGLSVTLSCFVKHLVRLTSFIGL